MTPQKNTAAGYEFLVTALKNNPDAEYAELKARAEAQSLTVFPIMYGRAKASLGLVKVAKRGSKKKAAEEAAAADRPHKTGRGPGRPRKVTSPADTLSQVLDGMRAQERENQRLRETLLKLRQVIEQAL